MRLRPATLLAIACSLSALFAGTDAHAFHARRVDVVAGPRVMLLSLTSVTRPLVRLFAHGPRAPKAIDLRDDQGWRVVGFPEPDRGSGVLVEVAGEAEFDRAEVLLASGELRALDLRSAIRGDGVFELMDLGTETEVRLVRIRARANTPHARLRLLFAR